MTNSKPPDSQNTDFPAEDELLGEFRPTMPHPGAQGVYADTIIDAPENTLRFLVTAGFDETALNSLRVHGEVRVQPDLPKQPAVFKRALANADVVFITSDTVIDTELLQDSKRLKTIACTEHGHQNIDLDACRRRGIEVIYVPEANAQSIAEYVISAALLLRRQLFVNAAHAEAMAAGKWQRDSANQGSELFGATLGLIGLQDAASQRIAYLAQALGMRVVGFDSGIAMDDPIWAKRAIKPLFMADLLRTADIVSLHLPRSVHSRRLIDAPALSTMKSSAVLINACAGGVVDEEALVAALRAGQLAGVALDVFDREPLNAPNRFAQCPNLLLTPHVAGDTHQARQRVTNALIEKVLKSLGLGDVVTQPAL